MMNRWIGLALAAVALLASAGVSRAAPVVYDAHLSGAAESPPNASPGTGFALVIFDEAAHSLRVEVTFSGLLGNTIASHIHAATAVPGTGNAMVATTVPTFPNFPLGVTSGTYDMTFDTSLASTYNPAFVTAHGGTVAGAETFLGQSLAAGTAYLNIHTSVVPGGEIRGFLQAVPEPQTLVLGGSGAIALAGLGLRRRKLSRSGA